MKIKRVEDGTFFDLGSVVLLDCVRHGLQLGGSVGEVVCGYSACSIRLYAAGIRDGGVITGRGAVAVAVVHIPIDRAIMKLN